MAELSDNGVLVCDGERVVVANHAARQLLAPGGGLEGVPLNHALPGWTVDLLPLGAETDTVVETPHGPATLRLSRRMVVHRSRSYAVVTVADRGARHRHEAELTRLRDTDALTGLLSRARFGATLDAAAVAADGPVSVLLVGLDRFGAMTDSVGHAAGDQLLRGLAAQILAAATGARCVARLGDDRFGLLLDRDPAGAEATGAALVDILAAWLRTDGHAPNLGVSAGLATGTAGGALWTAAELALRQARAEGGSVCRPYRAGAGGAGPLPA